MKFRFSVKITLICSLLIIGMLRASYWQWQRHLAKTDYINTLQQRLEKPIIDINELLKKNTDLEQITFRRVEIVGKFDFAHEVVLRNRRVNDRPGVFVLTPLKIRNSEHSILVSRGFIPLSHAEKGAREIFHNNSEASFTALLKPSQEARLFSPSDPPSGGEHPWVDAWLRVDLDGIGKQLPYKILPIYAEIMPVENAKEAESQIVVSKSDKADLFFLGSKSKIPAGVQESELKDYPIEVFDNVVPAARHLGYVFEWAGMALLTFIIALILQFRRPKIPA